MRHNHLFAFEHDFVETLRCVPMAVRLKLDRAGVKLTLRQWSRFHAEDRRELLATPCDAEAEITAYRDRLHALVASRTGETPCPLPQPYAAIWNAASPPRAVGTFAHARGIPAPTPGEGLRLSELQRFVLVKLSRDNHDNVNFALALREFRQSASL